jgi:hypothetical protein
MANDRTDAATKPAGKRIARRRPTGRPSKKNHEVIVGIIRDVSLGLPLKEAAHRAGVHPATLRRWRSQDEAVDQAVEAARAAFVQRNLEVVQQAAANDWKAAAWLLERRRPEAFGRRQVVEASVEAIPVVDVLTGKVLGPGGEDEEG